MRTSEARRLRGEPQRSCQLQCHESGDRQRKAEEQQNQKLIRHIYEVDPLVCPRCGATMKIISFITEQRVIRAILESVRRTCTPSTAGSRHPRPRPSRDCRLDQ
ncbi:MAG TPA: hypothetical protein VGK04_07545 [Thermoanaerobaculia bacterium]|jgi:hypothetical protein